MGSTSRRTLSLLLLFLICTVYVNAAFIVGIRVLRYRNLVRGTIRSCDGSSDVCGYYFTFCLQLESTTPTPQSCPLGQQQTEFALSRDVDEAVFGTTGFLGLQNPFVFTGASWPGSARLLVQVDEGDDDNVVDRLLIELEAPQGILVVEPTVFIGEGQNIELQMAINVMSNITGTDGTEIPTFGTEPSAGGLVAGVIVAVTLGIGISIIVIVALVVLLKRTLKPISGEQSGPHQKGLTIGDNPTYGDSPLQVPSGHNPDSSALVVTAEPNDIECSYHRYECASADSVVDTAAVANTSSGEQQQTQEHPPSCRRNELDGSHSYEYITTPLSVNNTDVAESPASRNGTYCYVSKQQVNQGRLQPDISAHYETCTT